MSLSKVFNINYFSSFIILYPAFPLYLRLPFLLLPSLFIHLISILFPLTSELWLHFSSLPFMGTSVEAHMSENSKLASTYKKGHSAFVLDLCHLTQNDYFQTHPLTCKPHNFISPYGTYSVVYLYHVVTVQSSADGQAIFIFSVF